MWECIQYLKVEKRGRIEEHFEYVDQNLSAQHQGYVGQHEYL